MYFMKEVDLEALQKSPPSVSNQWYRYHTADASSFTDTTAPTISSGIVAFNGRKVGATLSYSGMYQKLSGLTVGKEYEISVQTAKTVSDVILIYINATVETENNISVYITGVSIKEQQSYLVPVYGTDIFGNAHNILRRQGDQTVA